MKIKYNFEKLGKTLYNLSVLTNIPVSFVPVGGYESYLSVEAQMKYKKRSEFCKYIQNELGMNDKCQECDKKILNFKDYKSHICHAGLYDGTFPVIKNGVTAGYLLFGCFRCQKSPKKPYGINDPKAIKLYKERPFFTDEQTESFKNLLPDIFLDDAIVFEYSDISNEICDFIKYNLDKELTVQSLCKKFHISKNTLYKLFYEHFDTTPNDYILLLRIEKAKELIPDKSLTINEAAQKSGFRNYSHFSRIFKKHTGHSPAQFRKSFSKTTQKHSRL